MCRSHKQKDQEDFWNILNPVLDSKVPFPLLDEMGKRLGESGKREMPNFLWQIFVSLT
jgi:hypothetical protein